jgi:RNA polymerase sigma-70 factor (ECF subfamily)
VTAAQGGDRAALERLLRMHSDRVWALCRRITGNDTDAQDASQEALLAIVKGLGRFDGSSRFSTWVYRVTTNACLDELRRRKRRPEPRLPEDAADLPAPGERDVGDRIAARLDVDAALARLPTDYRAAVVLRDLCGLDYAEIGEVLGIPPGTVRSRIARGRGLLVPLLTGNSGSPSERPTP